MKSINLGSAVLAGAVGTFGMTALMYAAPFMGLPPMDLLLALGSLLPIGTSPYLVGGLMHLATGGHGIVFTAMLLDNAGLPIPGELLGRPALVRPFPGARLQSWLATGLAP